MSQYPIYTIGYGKRDINEFIDVLRAHGIAFLIDVRSQPYSRYKPDFSKKALAAHLEAAGIRYVFMGAALGGRPQEPACYNATGQLDYAKVEAQDFYQAGIERLKKAYRQQVPVVLMCSEGKPENCHRSKLIGKTLTAVNIPIAHIDENDQTIAQDEVRLRRNQGQMSLFAAAETPAPETTDMPLPPPPPEFDDFIPYDDSYPGDEYDAYQEYALHGDPSPPDLELPEPPPPYDGPMNAGGARSLLKQIFGFDQFRPLQAKIIDSLLAGQDTLAIMPTGSGKSLCYQLPALMLPGLTVVVSPLISLMADQVAALQALGIPAVALNSSLSFPEYRQTVDAIRTGRVKLLYAAPETLLRPETLAMLESLRVDCLAIDEAHCISEWGHDFRPEYRQLTDAQRRLPDAVALALTATATQRVRDDIKRSLGIPDAAAYVASFDRENLFLAVEPKSDTLAQTLTFLKSHPEESGIIYCTTRRRVDELSEQLRANGWDALPYHAGLDSDTRRRHQRQFSRDDVPIIVATIAFGMGIDKSNVRFILHVDLPKNLESYYQQIGRAGRDGLRADCLLLYSYSDVSTINYFIQQQADAQQRGARMRLDAMLGFVETADCRRRPLLNYFNEAYEADNCEMCDNCTTEAEDLTDLTVPAQKFLSCVKRTGEIFGVNHIIKVLRGSQAQDVLKRGHDTLSTYNIGGEFSKKQWKYLARGFLQQGLIERDPKYGSLSLTEQAYAVFRGEEKVWGTLPEQTRRQTAVAAGHDAALFNQLRAKRKELADAADLPPYTIFHDRTLVEMATYFPQSRATFAQLYGVGQVKLEKYADEFLPLIRAHCAENEIEEKQRIVRAAPAGSGGKSRREEVAELFNDGRSVPEIAAHFGIKHSTVLGHLWKAIQAGAELRSDNELLALSDLPPAEQERALDAFAAHGPDFLRPVYDALDGTVGYDDLRLLRLHFILTPQE